MRRSHIFILLVIMALFGCATDKSMQDDTDNPQGPGQENATADTSQNNSDVANQENPPPPADQNGQPPQDQVAQSNQPPPPADQPPADQQAPPPPAAENEPAPPAAESVNPQDASIPPASTEKPARVTALDFNANLNGGTIILKTNKSVTYTTRKNEATNQFVVELQNTIVPKRFQRPYNTKEFPGPVASINAYQAKGAPRTARIVVQLRQAVEPDVQQNGKTISIASSGGTSNPPQNVTEGQSDQQEATGATEGAETNGTADTTEATQTSSDQTESSSEKSEVDILQPNDKVANDFLSGDSKFYGRPISLEVKDADIRDVLRLISEESGVNLLVQDDVTGKITLKLRRVPWDQALLVVLKSKQLGYIKDGNILRITQQKTIEAEASAAKKTIESQRDLLPLHVKVFTVSYAVARDIEFQVKDFLTPRGKARADTRTNSVVVTDVDEVLRKVQALIDRLDTQTPQVLIEAKIVEAREQYSRLIGVNWNFSGASTNLSPNSAGVMSTYQPRATIQPVTSQQAAIGDIGVTFGNLDFFGNLDASLKLLESESLVKIISAPRIVTIDRQEATIDQTTQFPIFNSTISPSGAAQPSVTFQDVALKLVVKPQISADGGVTMDINVNRDFPEAPEFGANGASARPLNKRHAQTKVLVPNGDTVVIGGIYQSDVSEGESGVPWLGKLPIIGALFRQRNVDREKNELVIFLTPRILNQEKSSVTAGNIDAPPPTPPEEGAPTEETPSEGAGG